MNERGYKNTQPSPYGQNNFNNQGPSPYGQNNYANPYAPNNNMNRNNQNQQRNQFNSFNPAMMQGVRHHATNDLPSGVPVSSLSKSARIGFIRKVYSILFCQLTLTALFIVIGAVSESYRNFVENNFAVYVLSIIGYIACIIALVCCRSLGRKVPTNYILLTILTVCMAYMTTMTTIYYPAELLIYAALLTALMVSALTLYACTTKSDFTMMGGMLFVGGMVLLGAGIAQIFLQVA